MIYLSRQTRLTSIRLRCLIAAMWFFAFARFTYAFSAEHHPRSLGYALIAQVHTRLHFGQSDSCLKLSMFAQGAPCFCSLSCGQQCVLFHDGNSGVFCTAYVQYPDTEVRVAPASLVDIQFLGRSQCDGSCAEPAKEARLFFCDAAVYFLMKATVSELQGLQGLRLTTGLLAGNSLASNRRKLGRSCATTRSAWLCAYCCTEEKCPSPAPRRR